MIKHQNRPAILFGEQHFFLTPFTCAVGICLKNQQCGLFGSLFDIRAEVVGVEDSVAIEECVELQFVLKKCFELDG